MSLILIVSIAIRLVAMGWSIVLLRRIRDWRIGLMTAMFGLMALRQIFTQLEVRESWVISITSQATELPGLIVSILAFLVVVFLGRLIHQEAKTMETSRESELHLRKILDGISILIGLMTPDGTLIEANKTALEVAGLKPEDVLGKPFEEAYWWSYSEPIKQELRKAIRRAKQGEPSRYDVVVRVGEDRFITIDFCLQPLFDEAGRVTYMIPSATDITERVRLKAEDAERIKIEKAIGQVLHEGLRSTDPTAAGQACLNVAMEITSSAFGFVGELNERGRLDTTFLADPGWEACRITKNQAVVQISNMEIRGIWGEVIKHKKTLITNDPSSHRASVGIPAGHPPLRCFLGVPLSRGEQAFGVICMANKDGGYTEKDRESLERLSAAFVMALDRSRAEKSLREAHDKLEAKVAERTKELAQANIRLKEIDLLKSEFLATMSHELRTPLNSIIGFTGMILQGLTGEINEEQRKQLSMVYGSAKHLLGLINDILDLSRIESGKMNVSMERFNIHDVISNVSQSLSPMISKKGLRLILDIPDETLEIYSDRKKILQILLNLFNNAVKFTETGEVKIGCKFDNDNLEVSVSDTGIGIKKENMDYLFEAFRQVDGTAQRRYEGAGLGLYLCRKLVMLLGGRIWAESEYGRGSRFTFTLPVRLEEKERHEKKDIGGRG